MRSVKQLLGYSLGALDGEIGRVRGFHFDDRDWVIRCVVADGGGSITDRKVFVSPSALGKVCADLKLLEVTVTRETVTHNSGTDADSNFSGEHRVDSQRFDASHVPSDERSQGLEPSSPSPPSRLHSVQEVTGFALKGPDATIGHVEDFLVDDLNWAICFLVIAMSYPSFGKNVLIPPQTITNARWPDSTLFVDLTRKEVESHCEYQHRGPTPYSRSADVWRRR